MVKKGGTKRKIPIEKIVKKESLATCHTKRLQGLFSKASQLCLLNDAQMAILATPQSSNSNVSFYSYGHSSVDGIVSAFLAGQRPASVPVPQGYNRETREDIGISLTRKDLGLDLWWEDESLARSDNPQELTNAMNSISKLLSDFKELRQREAIRQGFVNDEEINDVVVSEPVDQNLNLRSVYCIPNDFGNDVFVSEPLDQTLNLQNTSAICCIPDDIVNDVVVSEQGTQEPLDQTLNLRPVYCIPDDFVNDFFVSDNGTQEPLDQTLNVRSVYCIPDDLINDIVVSENGTQEPLDQTLNLQSVYCIPDDFVSDVVVSEKVTQDPLDQTLNLQSFYCIPDDFVNDVVVSEKVTQDPLDQTLNLQSTSAICCIPDDLQNMDTEILEISGNFSTTDNNNNKNNNVLPAGNLDGGSNQDMEIDQLIDFENIEELEKFAESLLMNSEAVNGNVSMDKTMFSASESVKNGGLVEDDLHFSDIFNELTTITTL